MNDGKNNQVTGTAVPNKNAYSIPGVIIPEQTTDAGSFGSGQNVVTTQDSGVPANNSGDVQNVNWVQTNNVSSNPSVDASTNSSVYSIPGVIIPEQTTDAGSFGSNGIKTETVSFEQNLNQINQVNQISQISTSPQMPQVATVVDNNVPVMFGQTPVTMPVQDVSNSKKKKKKGKKEKNNGGGATALTGFLFFLVLILLGVVGYFVYNEYFAYKQVVDPVKEWQKKRTVNVESLVVKELYSYVNLQGCDEQINFFYDDSRTVVNASDLSSSTKNYLAYNQLKHSSLDKKVCSTYSKALHKNDKDGIWYCGDEYASSNTTNNYNDERALTYVISGDSIKAVVERIFGPTSYKAETFNIGSSSRYLYDSTTDSYIFQSYYGGASCTGYKNQLSSAHQEGDILTITVTVTNKVTNVLMNYNYQFKESSNGNYYFVSLNKTAV